MIRPGSVILRTKYLSVWQAIFYQLVLATGDSNPTSTAEGAEFGEKKSEALAQWERELGKEGPSFDFTEWWLQDGLVGETSAILSRDPSFRRKRLLFETWSKQTMVEHREL